MLYTIHNDFDHTVVSCEYRNLVIFSVENISLLRTVLISYAPHIVYETRAESSLLKNILNFRADGSVRN